MPICDNAWDGDTSGKRQANFLHKCACIQRKRFFIVDSAIRGMEKGVRRQQFHPEIAPKILLRKAWDSNMGRPPLKPVHRVAKAPDKLAALATATGFEKKQP
jgi:hypothetical protein